MAAEIDVVGSAHANARVLHFSLLGFRLQTQAPARLWVTEDGQDAVVADAVQRHAALADFPSSI